MTWSGARSFLGLVALFAGIYYFPQLLENRSNSCSALERSLLNQGNLGSEVALLRVLQGSSDGTIASKIVKKEYPNIPSEIGCVITYWRVTLDPTIGQDMLLRGLLIGDIFKR